MADVAAQKMHEHFANWHSFVSLGDDRPRLQTRWEGVSSVVKDADRNTVEGLLRLAYRSRQGPERGVLQAIRQAFKAADGAFEMSGNDRELQVLAGACLAVLMESEQDIGPIAALSATTAGLNGARNPDLPMKLGAIGETEIVRWGETRRERPDLTTHFASEQVVSELMENQSWESVGEAFELVGSAFEAVDDFLRVQDEELQILWWLTGQHSSAYNCAFDAIPAQALPLVLATELADKTTVVPGPPSVEGILSRAGLKRRRKIRIAAAVNAADSKWLEGVIGEFDPSPVSTPLHEAIRRQLETGPGDAWVAGWAASTGVEATYALSGLTLGNLFYRERLLLLFE